MSYLDRNNGVYLTDSDFSADNFNIVDIVNRITAGASRQLPEQVEVVTALRQGSHVNNGKSDTTIKQFHPEPFIFALQNQILHLDHLRADSERQLLMTEERCKKMEAVTPENLESLALGVDEVLAAFRKLEKRVGKIAHTSMSAGQTIEASSNAQRQSRFAQFVIRCFIDLNTGDESRAEPLLIGSNEKKLVDGGKLLQLLESISDELNAQINKDHELADRLEGTSPHNDEDDEDDEEEEEEESRHTFLGGRNNILFNKLAEKPKEPEPEQEQKVIQIKAEPPVRNEDGTVTTTVTRYFSATSYETVITTVSANGLEETTQIIRSDETVVKDGTLTIRPMTSRDQFKPAANLIEKLSILMEGRLVGKFREYVQRKQYVQAYEVATVIATFKERRAKDVAKIRAQRSGASNQRQSTYKLGKYGLTSSKFGFHSEDILGMMKIPTKPDRKDMSGFKSFNLFFTRVVNNIVNTLRQQCQVLPLILPSTMQTFEEIVFTIFQSLLPQLMAAVLDYQTPQQLQQLQQYGNKPQGYNAKEEFKVLKRYAIMYDLVRRAICEVLCMVQDLQFIVDKRNAQLRQRALITLDTQKSQTRKGGDNKHDIVSSGLLLQQLNGGVTGGVGSGTVATNTVVVGGQEMVLSKGKKGLMITSAGTVGGVRDKDDDDDDSNAFKTPRTAAESEADALMRECFKGKPPFLYGYCIIQNRDDDDDDGTGGGNNKNRRKKGSMTKDFDDLQQLIPSRTNADIDERFASDKTPIVSAMRDSIMISITSFTTSWFDREDNYLKAYLGQMREELLVSRYQNEMEIKKIMEKHRGFLNLITSKEALMEEKMERQLWLQSKLQDSEVIEKLLRTLNGCIKRSLIISQHSKRSQDLDHFFMTTAKFLYRDYISPILSETFIRFLPWGNQLYKLNEDQLLRDPAYVSKDIFTIYKEDYVNAYLERQQQEDQDEDEGVGRILPSPRNATISNAMGEGRQGAKRITYQDFDYSQKQYQLHCILPELTPGQLSYVTNTIMQYSTINATLGDPKSISNGGVLAEMTQAVSTAPPPVASPEESSRGPDVLGKLRVVGSVMKDAVDKTTTALYDVTTLGKEDIGPEPEISKSIPLAQQVTLTHDEVMLDLIFTLTVVRQCIELDRRITNFLYRYVHPHLSSNLHLISLQQARLDGHRGFLESKVRHYLQCFGLYMSCTFNYILKQIPSGYYNMKDSAEVLPSPKVATLWLQAAKSLESSSSSVIASLIGANVDDFLIYFIQCVLDRLTAFIITQGNAGGISQSGAPLLIQDLSTIQRPVHEIGLPQVINKFMEFKNIVFIFFTPANSIYSFLMERAGTMRVDLKVVTAFLQARSDYRTDRKIRLELESQLNQYKATLPKRPTRGQGNGVGPDSQQGP